MAQRDLVAVDGRRRGAARRASLAGSRRRPEVGAEGEARAVGDVEVGDGAVGAGGQGGQVDRPGAVGVEGRVDVVEDGQVAVDEDEVQVLLVVRREVENRARRLGLRSRSGRCRRRRRAGVWPARAGSRLWLETTPSPIGAGAIVSLVDAAGPKRRSCADSDGEDAREHDAESAEALNGVHDATSGYGSHASSGRRSAGTVHRGEGADVGAAGVAERVPARPRAGCRNQGAEQLAGNLVELDGCGQRSAASPDGCGRGVRPSVG